LNTMMGKKKLIKIDCSRKPDFQIHREAALREMIFNAAQVLRVARTTCVTLLQPDLESQKDPGERGLSLE